MLRVRERGALRGAVWAALGVVVLGLFAWFGLGQKPAPSVDAASVAAKGGGALPWDQASSASAADASLAGSRPPAARSTGPLTEAERQARLAHWRERLARAQQALVTYQQVALYPHESRPASEHPDQLRPFEPVAEERPLRVPGGTVTQGVRLKTTQERTFLSGQEASRVTLSLVTADGQTLPLRVQRAVLHEVTQPGRTASTNELNVALNDAGQTGDVTAGDGVYSVSIQPVSMGFSGYAGLIRLEVNVELAGQGGGPSGYLFYDFIYSPGEAARWLPGVREALQEGSLAFFLKAEVLQAGRYVVSARVDDASGRTIALALFNHELAAGLQDIRLPVFGRLLHDSKPQFPLRLRDVEAFLLKADVYPDRVMLPRRPGVVHTSALYALSDFSDATWSSEERDRYMAELGRDVTAAQDEVKRLAP